MVSKGEPHNDKPVKEFTSMQLPKFISKLFQTTPPQTTKSSNSKPLMTELMPRDSIFFSFMHTPFNPDVLVGKKGGLLIYEKMRQDDTIKACLNLKKYAVLSSGWTVEPPRGADKVSMEATEFALYNLQYMEGTFDDDLLEIMTGFEYGFSVSEKIFQVFGSNTPYNGKVGIKTIKTRKPHWIDIKTDKFGNIEEDGIIQNRTSNYPKNKFILYTHDKTFDNPYGESDLRACYRAWWSKDIIIKFWNMWLERFGTPPVIGKITEALESGDETALKEIFKNLTSKTSMLLPKGVEVDILEVRGMGVQAYQKAIEAHDMAIARALLVPSLLGVTQQGGTGSYGQSRTHFNVFLWIIEKLRRTIEELINEQLIREVLDYNYHLEAYPRFAFVPLNEDKKMELAKLFIEAVSKGAITPTLQDENVFRNLLDLPEKTKEEEAEEKEKEGEEKTPPEEEKEFEEKQFGGLGSGFPGHGGRPGVVGGSSSKGGAGGAAEGLTATVIAAEKDILARNNNEYETGVALDKDGKVLLEKSGTAGDMGEPPKRFTEEQFAYNRKLSVYEKKVDFKQIENNLNTLEVDTKEQLVKILTQQKQAFLGFISSKIQKAELTLTLVNNLQLKYQLQLQQTIREMLRESFTLGREDARREVGEPHYKVKIPPTQAIEWFEKKSFYVKSVLNEQLLKQIKQTLVTAMEIGESLPETIAKIEAAYEPFLGDSRVIVDEKQPQPYRIETLVRTNQTGAYNWGRVAMFNDPELEGFVEAVEYSAILDGRQTQICENLDGKIIRMNDPDLQRITPPNHFNCRSLLVPVTLADPPYAPIKRSEMDYALQMMPEGFGGRVGSD